MQSAITVASTLAAGVDPNCNNCFRTVLRLAALPTCVLRLTSCDVSVRYNALREENEGFSKMLVCLQSFGAAAAESSDNIPQIVSLAACVA